MVAPGISAFDVKSPGPEMLVDANLSEDETVDRARNDPHIAPLLVGKEIVRIVAVAKKLVNIVLR